MAGSAAHDEPSSQKIELQFEPTVPLARCPFEKTAETTVELSADRVPFIVDHAASDSEPPPLAGSIRAEKNGGACAHERDMTSAAAACCHEPGMVASQGAAAAGTARTAAASATRERFMPTIRASGSATYGRLGALDLRR